MHFSSRLPAQLVENPLSVARRACLDTGRAFTDLSASNPTDVGIPFTDEGELALALAPANLGRYQPDPRGLRGGREAIEASGGGRWNADSLLLTASSSESYSLLFKLLCDPGDEILVPQPSYPLFAQLTALECVRAVPYRMHYADGWCVDFEGLVEHLTPRTRAILVVNPNNPTGSYLSPAELATLEALCAERSMALIADEVFWPYSHTCSAIPPTAAGRRGCLTFTLDGLSKSCGLPQLKLGWIGVSGPQDRVSKALSRLELVADTYLSVGGPVMAGAQRLLQIGALRRQLIRERIAQSLAAVAAVVRRHPEVSLLRVEGGWSAILRLPAVIDEESLVLRAMDELQLLVYPGYFFDMAGSGVHVVVSLLVDPQTLGEALHSLIGLACDSVR